MTFGGALRSENVGMSNRNADEISAHRKPKVSLAMKINQGLGGPKARPKGVADGQPVNIPALPLCFIEATESWRLRVLLDLLLFFLRRGSSEFTLDNSVENSSQKSFNKLT